MKTKFTIIILSLSIYGCAALFSGFGSTVKNGISVMGSRTNELSSLVNMYEKKYNLYPTSLNDLKDFATTVDTLTNYYVQVSDKFNKLSFVNYNPDSLRIDFVSNPFNGDSVVVKEYVGSLLYQTNTPIVYVTIAKLKFVGDPNIRQTN